MNYTVKKFKGKFGHIADKLHTKAPNDKYRDNYDKIDWDPPQRHTEETIVRKCGACEGQGELIEGRTCPVCAGEGKYLEDV